MKIQWVKPSGLEIETNDMPETIAYCESLGWERTGASSEVPVYKASPDQTEEGPVEESSPDQTEEAPSDQTDGAPPVRDKLKLHKSK